MAKRARGTGSIYKRRDGRWAAQLRLPGRARPVTRYTRTQAEAVVALDDLRRAAQLGGLPSQRPTVEQAVSAWLSVQSARVRPRSLDVYAHLTARHLIPQLGTLRLDQVTPAHVEAFMAGRRKAGLSARSVNQIRTVLSQVLTQAQAWGATTTNPAMLTRPLRVQRREPTVWGLDTAREFMAATEHDRLAALWVLVIHTGMRRGELLGLRWSDVDLDASTLTVRRTVVRVRGQGLISLPPKTPAGRRTLTLMPAVVDSLRGWRTRQRVERIAAGPKWQDSGHVFTGRQGGAISPSHLTRRFRQLVNKAGLPPVRLHDTRHAAASYLAARGAPVTDIAAMLGHASAAFTLTTYAHAFAEGRERVAAMLADALADDAGKTA